MKSRSAFDRPSAPPARGPLARRAAALAAPLLATFLAGCASYFVRQQCANTNWFEHGRQTALAGRRVTGDELVRRCQDAEGKIDSSALDQGFKSGRESYCLPETAYVNGKSGEFFNPELCEGERLSTLKARHAQGVLEHCARSNGYQAGGRGKPYNGICPAKLEAEFLPEFNRGRKVFLLAEADRKESEARDIDRDIVFLERRRAEKLASIREMDAQGWRYAAGQNPEEVKRRRTQMDFEAQDFDRQIMEKRGTQSRLRDSSREMRAEASRL